MSKVEEIMLAGNTEMDTTYHSAPSRIPNAGAGYRSKCCTSTSRQRSVKLGRREPAISSLEAVASLMDILLSSESKFSDRQLLEKLLLEQLQYYALPPVRALQFLPLGSTSSL